MKTSAALLLLALATLLIGCTGSRQTAQEEEASGSFSDTLPAPYATRSAMNFSNVLGWEDHRTEGTGWFSRYQIRRWLR